jgi:hypothetical protein
MNGHVVKIIAIRVGRPRLRAELFGDYNPERLPARADPGVKFSGGEVMK